MNKFIQNIRLVFLASMSTTYVYSHGSEQSEQDIVQKSKIEDTSFLNVIKINLVDHDNSNEYDTSFKNTVLKYMENLSFTKLKQLSREDLVSISILFERSNEEVESVDFTFSSDDGYNVNITKGIQVFEVRVESFNSSGIISWIADTAITQSTFEKCGIRPKEYLSQKKLDKLTSFISSDITRGKLIDSGASVSLKSTIKYDSDNKRHIVYVAITRDKEPSIRRRNLVITGVDNELANKIKFHLMPTNSFAALFDNAYRSRSMFKKNDLYTKKEIIVFLQNKGYDEAKINSFRHEGDLVCIDVSTGPKYSRSFKITELSDSVCKSLTINERKKLNSILDEFIAVDTYNFSQGISPSLKEVIEPISLNFIKQLKKDDRCFFNVESSIINNISDKTISIVFYINPGLFKTKIGKVELKGTHRIDLIQELIPFSSSRQVYFSYKTLEDSIKAINKLDHIYLCEAAIAYNKGSVDVTYQILDYPNPAKATNFGGALNPQVQPVISLSFQDPYFLRTGLSYDAGVVITLKSLGFTAKNFGTRWLDLISNPPKFVGVLITDVLRDLFSSSLTLKGNTILFSNKYPLQYTTSFTPAGFFTSDGSDGSNGFKGKFNLGKFNLKQSLPYDFYVGASFKIESLNSADIQFGWTKGVIESSIPGGIAAGSNIDISARTNNTLDAISFKIKNKTAVNFAAIQDWTASRFTNSFQGIIDLKGDNATAKIYVEEASKMKAPYTLTVNGQDQTQNPGVNYFNDKGENIYSAIPKGIFNSNYSITMPFFWRGITARTFSPERNLSIVALVGVEHYVLLNSDAIQPPEGCEYKVDMKWQVYSKLYLRVPVLLPFLGSITIQTGIHRLLLRACHVIFYTKQSKEEYKSSLFYFEFVSTGEYI